ncbi:MAG TPA: ABC transporter permease [Kofleriaceae bacterium]|nr:ABC transporter permease [Kofleriaceae bacterium]
MKDLRDTLVIARRELLERVRSKWFAVMTLIGPIGMIAMIVIPALLARGSTEGTKVEIIDRTPSAVLAQPLAKTLGDDKWRVAIVDPATPESAEEAKIRGDQINGYISIAPDALDDGPIRYRGDNASSQAVQIVLQHRITEAVFGQRAVRAGLTATQLESLARKIDFRSEHTTGEGTATSGLGAFAVAYMLAFILYMVITLYGVAVMRSVVQEKASRVMELLVAAVKPRSLMAGKILGVGAAGLIQVGVWLAMGAILLAYRDEVLGAFGIAGGGRALPELAIGEIAVVLVYFVLGFFFYSAMYAAVGAMVSSEQETQQVQLPVTMLLIVGVLCLQVVSNDPRGSSAATMTMIPFWSPMLMPMRYVLGGASLGEVALSVAILAVSILVVVRAAAKIYRVGVLMYGKRPGARELLRWLRY